MKIHETASELRDQGTTYSNQQLNEILVRMPCLSYIHFKNIFITKLNYFHFREEGKRFLESAFELLKSRKITDMCVH